MFSLLLSNTMKCTCHNSTSQSLLQTQTVRSCSLNICGCQTVQLIIRLMIQLMSGSREALSNQLDPDGTAPQTLRQTELMHKLTGVVFTVANIHCSLTLRTNCSSIVRKMPVQGCTLQAQSSLVTFASF